MKYWGHLFQTHDMHTKLFAQDRLTFIFSIPNVSRLLIFKDHWNQSQVMRYVIAGLIDNKLYTKIYIGYHDKVISEAFFDGLQDTAVISLRVSGLLQYNYDVAVIQSIFANALRSKSNVMHFDNTRVSRERNVSTIDVIIKLAQVAKAKNSDEDINAA